MMVAYDARADEDKVMGYTEHGIPVTQKELEINTFNFERVRTNRREEFDIKVYYCFDISFAHRLVFQPWGGFSSLSRGDKIIPISFGRASRFPCTIRSITAVLKEKEDVEEN